MPTLRVLTMNVENLFRRFEFEASDMKKYVGVADALDDPQRDVLVKSFYSMLQDEIRTATALTIASADPDVICLQEVDSMAALKFFHDRYLRRMGKRREYGYKVLIEGNDPRGIDVAVLSRFKLEGVVTHQDMKDAAGKPVFSRDCLEVAVKSHGKYLTLFVNHLKSMMGGRAQTSQRRLTQCEAIVAVIEDRFTDPASENWVILGDLNDYYHVDGAPDAGHAFGPLDIGQFCVDLTATLPDDERWTHYWSGGDEYRQLDYLLASPAVAAASQGNARAIVRNGLPYRASRYAGERWPRTGHDRPKASDHCAVVADIAF